MCTLILLYSPDHPWPALLAGNRDELRDRPALPPARHWEDRPEVVAGLEAAPDADVEALADDLAAGAVEIREPTPSDRLDVARVWVALERLVADHRLDAAAPGGPAAAGTRRCGRLDSSRPTSSSSRCWRPC